MERTVLIVDDSIFIYEEMKRMLADTPYKVKGYAKNRDEALAVYEEIQPDIVTMDIILPGEDGLEITQELLKKYPTAKIIVVSSLAYEDTLTEATDVGASGFVYKPLEKDALIGALDQAFQ